MGGEAKRRRDWVANGGEDWGVRGFKSAGRRGTWSRSAARGARIVRESRLANGALCEASTEETSSVSGVETGLGIAFLMSVLRAARSKTTMRSRSQRGQ